MNLTNPDYVKSLKGNLRASFDSDSGKEVMRFLEVLCGWYDFSDADKDQIMIKHGRRQVLATIKTLIDWDVEQIISASEGGEF